MLRIQIVSDIRSILVKTAPAAQEKLEGYKTKDVRKILGCSVNKLVSLRIGRKLRWKKSAGLFIITGMMLRGLWKKDFELFPSAAKVCVRKIPIVAGELAVLREDDINAGPMDLRFKE